jgi:hypothetical protein
MNRLVGPAIIWVVINDPVTWVGEGLFAFLRTGLCLKVSDFPHAGTQQIAADEGAIRTSPNQRHFLDELLRDCSFFAHLVLRAVREVDSFGRSSDRNSGYKKSKALQDSRTPARSARGVFPRRRDSETLCLQAEDPQALWVEVGCRHAQIIVSGKVSYDNGENPNAAL